LVPGNALEVAGPALTRASQRVEQAVWVVLALELRLPSGAFRTAQGGNPTCFVKVYLEAAVGVALVASRDAGTGCARRGGHDHLSIERTKAQELGFSELISEYRASNQCRPSSRGKGWPSCVDLLAANNGRVQMKIHRRLYL
jgi:hypothetical protein